MTTNSTVVNKPLSQKALKSNKKFRLYGKKNKKSYGLTRIQALRDIPVHKVKQGDLGGWVLNESNLSQTGNAWIREEARISGYARVYGDALISENACIYGYAHIYGNALVYGNAQVYEHARVYGDAEIFKNAHIFGHARVYGHALVYGHARICGYVRVLGNTWEKSPLYIQGTREALTTSSHTEITIGCETHTSEEWLKRYEEIGKENDYSDEEIKEYFSLIKTAEKWLLDMKEEMTKI